MTILGSLILISGGSPWKGNRQERRPPHEENLPKNSTVVSKASARGRRSLIDRSASSLEARWSNHARSAADEAARFLDAILLGFQESTLICTAAPDFLLAAVLVSRIDAVQRCLNRLPDPLEAQR